MEIDTRFPTKLRTLFDAPERFRASLEDQLPSEESVRFLVHAPAFSTAEKNSPATERNASTIHSGAIITYFPLTRLADFHVGHQGRFGFLALQVHAAHGGEKLEIMFPPGCEQAVSKAMERIPVLAKS